MTNPTITSSAWMSQAALGALVARDWPRITRLLTLGAELTAAYIESTVQGSDQIDILADRIADEQAQLVELYMPVALKSDRPENVSSILPQPLHPLSEKETIESYQFALRKALEENKSLRQDLAHAHRRNAVEDRDGITIPIRRLFTRQPPNDDGGNAA